MVKPRDHRQGPYRPLNTLSSPQKPRYSSGTFTGREVQLGNEESSGLIIDKGNNFEDSSVLNISCKAEQARDGLESYGKWVETSSALGDSSDLFEGASFGSGRLTPSPVVRERRNDSLGTGVNRGGTTPSSKPRTDELLKATTTTRPSVDQFAPDQPAKTPHTTTSRKISKMVKERDARESLNWDVQPSVPKALQDLTNTASPEFGKSSPLRNPLRKDASKDAYSNLFNKNQARPELHRVPQPQQNPPPPAFNMKGAQPTGAAYANIPRGSSTTISGAHPPSMHNGPSSRISSASDIVEIAPSQFQPRQPSYSAAPVPIQMPANQPARTIPAAPRPMFSSGYNNGFQPVNPGYQRATSTNIFDPFASKQKRDSDDEFDEDAAIREDRGKFGAPDPYMYVDSSQANENLKALLEGAFDDEEEKIPRTRGRKKKRQQQLEEQEQASNSLAKALQKLEVNPKEEEPPVEEEEEEEDDGSVEGMKVKLLPHQVDGVAWMTDKEVGTRKKNGVLPKGGILADDMGLGKTIQSIALILSNPRPDKDTPPENPKNKILPTVGKGTLIVAPLALIKQWESEIATKVEKSHALKVLVHHGPNRTKSAETMKKYDVVVTTYQVLTSEHGASGDRPDGVKRGCFGVHWYRIILDEAHTIKNRNAKMTKACYDLRSHYRWCLTGTPMQNNLDELQSLIKFLRIKPYMELSNWKDSITGPMKNGRGGLAMKRLQYFLKAFMKRRTKDILKKEGALNFGGKVRKDGAPSAGGMQIVARNIEVVKGEFTKEERRFYDRLADRAQNRLAEMMGAEKQDYIGALVLLLRLRQACNHPNLTKSNVKGDKDALTTGSTARNHGTQTPRKPRDTDKDADDLADLLGGLTVETKRCDVCQAKLTSDNTTAGSIRCDECEDDILGSQKKEKKHKHRKHKHKKEKSKKHRHSKMDEQKDSDHQKLSRQRRLVLDSDDEDEGQGDWVVPKGQRGSDVSGLVIGTDDENAEGGGDWVKSDDSDESETEDEASSSRKKDDSFISHDTDEDGSPIVRHRKRLHQKKVINLVSDDDDARAGSETDDSGAEEDSEEDASETESESDSDIEYNASHLTPSTKIRHLLEILEKDTPDHKVIVFSQFTSMLDLIEPFIRRQGYNYTRYDGSMRNDLREASLNKLRTDKRTRVLLCSLKCGSLGLNLTAASRVVIMEPFWNPFVEEQAIDRVHRLNQTVDVTVYKLSILSSVEERIIDLQEAKRKLAQAAIEGDKSGVNKLSMKDIMNLFKRDAEYDAKHEEHHLEQPGLFDKMRVLDEPSRGSGSGNVTPTYGTTGVSASKAKKKTGAGHVEHGVYGRR